jgi:kumamolisin
MAVRKPLPTTIGCSWVWTPVDPSTLNPLFERMAAQGQSFFAASGDWGNWSPSNVSSWPAEGDYVTAVGGTSLTTNGPGGLWTAESAWGDSGSGVSPDEIAIPYWQQYAGVINSSNGGSTTYRNGPDVAANADFSYVACYDQSGCAAGWGGTSFAAPLWAGYIALLNQERALYRKPGIGFLNPAIYNSNSKSIAVARSFWYDFTFHDTTTGGAGAFNAVSGYDLVTGWGSPNGTGFINYYRLK